MADQLDRAFNFI